jgi:malate dehydrogenase
MASIKKVAVTGGSGQIAYSLLFRIANGDLFGKEQQIDLRICDLPEMTDALEGLAMELADCAFPLLHKVTIGHNLSEMFDDIELALLVGAKPRTKGMERGDLLQENGKIFVGTGRALNEAARKDAKIIVVGNPCNTNCLITMHHAPKLLRKNFHAMTRLDQNRAAALLATKANVPVESVRKLSIWGNHSATQVPDYTQVEIGTKRAVDLIQDQHWLQQEFISQVQGRGAEIIAKRGKSSAASAASSLIDATRALYETTREGDWYSSAVCTDDNPYGIEEDLIFSFPLRTDKKGNYEIVKGLEWDFFIKERIAVTQRELLEEKSHIAHLLKG